jgi:hypothetical protein
MKKLCLRSQASDIEASNGSLQCLPYRGQQLQRVPSLTAALSIAAAAASHNLVLAPLRAPRDDTHPLRSIQIQASGSDIDRSIDPPMTMT